MSHRLYYTCQYRSVCSSAYIRTKGGLIRDLMWKKDMLSYFFYQIVIVGRILVWYRLQKGIWYIPEPCDIFFYQPGKVISGSYFTIYHVPLINVLLWIRWFNWSMCWYGKWYQFTTWTPTQSSSTHFRYIQRHYQTKHGEECLRMTLRTIIHIH